MSQVHGSCHCDNVTFRLDWPAGTTRIPARACGCTFSRRHGGAWTSHPAASLAVRVAYSGLVNRYVFGTGMAGIHVCTRCGAIAVVTSEIDRRVYAVESVNAFDGLPR